MTRPVDTVDNVLGALRLLTPEFLSPRLRRLQDRWQVRWRQRCDNCSHWDPDLADETMKQSRVAQMMADGCTFHMWGEGEEAQELTLSKDRIAGCTARRELVVDEGGWDCEDYSRDWRRTIRR